MPVNLAFQQAVIDNGNPITHIGLTDTSVELTGGSPAYARKAVTWAAADGSAIARPTADLTFDVVYDLDRVVDLSGVSTASSSVPMNQPIIGPPRRDGAANQNLSGPLGTTLANRLANPTTGIILNSWIDANRALQGGAGAFVNQ